MHFFVARSPTYLSFFVFRFLSNRQKNFMSRKRTRVHPYWAVHCRGCRVSLPLEEATRIRILDGQVLEGVPKSLPECFFVKCPQCEYRSDYMSKAIFQELFIQLFYRPQIIIPVHPAQTVEAP